MSASEADGHVGAPSVRGTAKSNAGRLVVYSPWWFLLPALGFYGFAVIIPSIIGLGAAFTNWDGLSRTSDFIGFDNFVKFLSDRGAVGSLRQTLFIAVAVMVLQNVIGLLLALGVSSGIRTNRWLRVIYFAPAVIAPVMTAYLWKFILGPGGGLDAIFEAVNLEQFQLNWLGSTDLAIWSVIMVIVWQHAGLSMVIFLAGLEAIPKEITEAAELDGAGPVQRFFFVTLPLLKPAIIVTTTLTLIGGLKQFDTVWAMTSGGPAGTTETLATIIFKNAFQFGAFGYSIALAVVLTMIAMPISWFQYRSTHERRNAS